jgi:hypothetical protein
LFSKKFVLLNALPLANENRFVNGVQFCALPGYPYSPKNIQKKGITNLWSSRSSSGDNKDKELLVLNQFEFFNVHDFAGRYNLVNRSHGNNLHNRLGELHNLLEVEKNSLLLSKGKLIDYPPSPYHSIQKENEQPQRYHQNDICRKMLISWMTGVASNWLPKEYAKKEQRYLKYMQCIFHQKNNLRGNNNGKHRTNATGTTCYSILNTPIVVGNRIVQVEPVQRKKPKNSSYRTISPGIIRVEPVQRPKPKTPSNRTICPGIILLEPVQRQQPKTPRSSTISPGSLPTTPSSSWASSSLYRL